MADHSDTEGDVEATTGSVREIRGMFTDTRSATLEQMDEAIADAAAARWARTRTA